MTASSERDLARLARAAQAARRASGRVVDPRLPGLVFMTDPTRVADPLAVAGRLPPGAGVIYRHFGAADARTTARALAALARTRGLVLVIAADPALADAVGADGVHWPERLIRSAATWRRRRPAWLMTAAAHSAAALRRAAAAGVDAALLSPVLPSRSPSAARPLGVARTAALARSSRTPVIALGGVTAGSANRLVGAGVIGLAGVEGFAGSW